MHQVIASGDVDLEAAEVQMETFRQQLAATGVTDPRHILNADETGLLYKNMPTYTYVRSIEAKTVRDSKNMEAKDRITLQIVATADGHKGPILVIGKQKSPRCFSALWSVLHLTNLSLDGQAYVSILGGSCFDSLETSAFEFW